MTIRQPIRPGGRSERIQKAVHSAVRDLVPTLSEAELTIPVIASHAKVTPSTIYRRWGSLTELLADVAAERLRPAAEPQDTGSLRGDLEAWLESFSEEMSSGPGYEMVRDVMASASGPDMACRCSGYTAGHLGVMVARAKARDEWTPSVDTLIDTIVAPVMYRILFVDRQITRQYREDLLRRAMDDRARP